MSANQGRACARQFSVQAKSRKRNAPSLQCACEAVEKRVLLSTATFATPLSVSVPDATAPLGEGAFGATGTPNDLLVATPTTVQILTGNSDGSFSLGSSIPLPANPATQTPFQVGDFSGSGSLDIVLDSHNSVNGNGEITYETNNGNATFTAGSVSTITDGGLGFTPLSGRAGDFNGDGETDLAIVGKPATGNELVLAILTSNGDGTFTETADYPIAGSNAAGNISDEQVFTGVTNEIIVNDGSSGNFDVFSGPGDGTFTQLTPTPLNATLANITSIDGNEDFIIADGDQVSLLVNQGDGTFQPDPQGPITLPGPIDALAAGDFNLDGNPDIITNQGILFGNGDGTYNTTPEALPVAIDGGNNFTNTIQPLSIANGKLGFAAFAAAGNAVVTAVNQTLPEVSIDLQSSNNPANPGSDVQLTATISSADPNITATPTGSVTFFNGVTAIGTKPLVDGTATLDAGSTLDTGSNSITAVYSGDARFATGTSSPLVQTGLATTTTTVVSSENPSLAGDDVIFTATVSGNDGAGDVPSGNVEFFDNGTDLGGGLLDSTGTATFDTSGSLAIGSHPITAQYQGDSNFAQSVSSPLTQTVNQPVLVPIVAATTLPTAIVAGASAHGTVTVALTNETSSQIAADQINVFASTNGTVAAATSLVSDVSKHGITITPGQTVDVKLTVKSFPTDLAEGTYTLLAEVKSSLGQDSNSVTGPSVNVAAAFVQLAGTSATGAVKPSPVKVGKTANLTITLSNSGNVTSGAATLNIGLSIDGQTESTVLANQSATIKIKPNHTGVLHLHLKIPTTQPAGSYQPFVAITDDGDVATVIGQVFAVQA